MHVPKDGDPDHAASVLNVLERATKHVCKEKFTNPRSGTISIRNTAKKKSLTMFPLSFSPLFLRDNNSPLLDDVEFPRVADTNGDLRVPTLL